MSSPVLVVGVGASAGGVDTLCQFFRHVPADAGIAFVAIVHMSPEHDSRLAEVLQSSAVLPVTWVEDRVKVQRNHVYVLPPNRSVSMVDGHLALAEISRIEQRRAPIDIFFRTLGDAHGARAVGVVLSGTGSDGSLGLKRIKENGGLCFAQDPDEAAYADMPRASIAAGIVDHVLPVAAIPDRILALKGHLESLTTVASPVEDASAADEPMMREVFGLLRNATGHDFSNYKRATILRRIGRRMAVHEIGDLAGYVKILPEKPEELQALLKDLLISVTHFFRDAGAFQTLQTAVIPKLFDGKTADEQLRVWVPACASGEEAYSIAILLGEYAATIPAPPMIQVFATDIDHASVAVARQGWYPANAVADITPDRLARCFKRDEDGYRVSPSLRQMVLFSTHNIIKDPPFSHLDLASCRNLLIYLNKSAQRRVAEVLHFALRPSQYLFVGTSESLEGSSDLFRRVHREAGIYQSRFSSNRKIVSLPDPRPVRVAGAPIAHPRDAEVATRERAVPPDLHLRLLEEYAPPSVLIQANYDIVHISPHAARYLQFAGGDASVNLLDVVRSELRSDLRAALAQAAVERTPVEAPALAIDLDNAPTVVSLLVRPVTFRAELMFVVLFSEVISEQGTPQIVVRGEDALRQLEAELADLRGQLRHALDGSQIQSEDHQAALEEQQAMNEELRSSSEELETSREELQSLNEELQTVNQELKIKVEEQTRANDDMRNLVNATEIGTIFLDKAGRIKMFTPTTRAIFKLIESDRGRRLSDMSSVLVGVDVHAIVTGVIDSLERSDTEVKTTDGRWVLMRALPYRTADDRIDGAVLTFTDITHRKIASDAVALSEQRLRLIVESVVDYAIFTTDPDGHIDRWYLGAERMFGYTTEEAIGQSAGILFTPNDRAEGRDREEWREARVSGRGLDERWHVRKDGSRFFVSGITAPLSDASGAVVGFVTVARDITDRKQSEQALQQSHDALETNVEERAGELLVANQALSVELAERAKAEQQIRGLLGRVLTVQEEERRRIARDLHDHLGQQVAGLRLKLDSIKRDAGAAPGLVARLEDAEALIAKVDTDLDFFTWELRPAALDDLGLAEALTHYVQEWSQTFGIRADFHTARLGSDRLRPDLDTNMYRIAQEALNNVYKHANASNASVLLERRGDELVLVVEDDGVGFNAELRSASAHSIGLLGMRERAILAGGTLEIESRPGRGTTVFVRVPYILR